MSLTPHPKAAADVTVGYIAASPHAPGWSQYAVEPKTSGRPLAGDIEVRLHDDLRQADLGFTTAPARTARATPPKP
ncbi:hypothetical protein AB0I54_45950 [Streptomyces sp. NPDC050625]|uniref:hypothetical protein n=1 Tax=Streptomyces sp. NPDC050625 TaxID=3154629 RepID=UPI00343BAFF4